MELILNHDYKYAVEQIMLMLFPGERPVYPEAAPQGEPWASVTLNEGNVWTTATTVLHIRGERFSGAARISSAALKEGQGFAAGALKQRIIKQGFYRAAVKALGKKPVWGSLSGIRPAKLMRGLLDTGMEEDAALEKFRQTYDVSPERAALCLDAALAGRKAEHASTISSAV